MEAITTVARNSKASGDLNRKAIKEFIVSFTKDNGYPPSIMEIVDGCGLSSTSVAHHHLNALKKVGVVTWVENKNRTLRVIG